MSDIEVDGQFAEQSEDDPFGVGPAIEDPDPLYTDEIYEQFGDYDLFGPFAWRAIDYYTEEIDLDAEE